jgi:hypothetical protein
MHRLYQRRRRQGGTAPGSTDKDLRPERPRRTLPAAEVGEDACSEPKLIGGQPYRATVAEHQCCRVSATVRPDRARPGRGARVLFQL